MYNYKADKKKLKAIVKKNECRIRIKMEEVKIVPPQKKCERKREKKKKMGRKKHRARSSSLR